MYMSVHIDADFHVAIVATASGEKLLVGRRTMTQMITPYDIKLVLVQKITFVFRKINENCCHQSCTF